MEQSNTTTPEPSGNLSELRARLLALRPAAMRSHVSCQRSDAEIEADEQAGRQIAQPGDNDALHEWLSLSLQVAEAEQEAALDEQDARSGDETPSLSLEGAFKLLAQMAASDERGMLGDHASEADQINRCRAAFAQSRGQLVPMEEDFEAHVCERVEELHRELSIITNRGRNQ
jgi:hypothetical protein